MNKTALDLQQGVLALIARGVAQPTSDDEFNELARAIFAFQYEQCAAYRAYCARLKLTPHTVQHWKQIPAVPTSAFKDFALTCFPVEEAVAEFHTSGTTREKSGRHFLPTLELYDAAIKPNFAAHLLADGARLPMMVLTPSPEEAPHSSLSHMMGVVMREFGTPESAYYVERGALCVERLVEALREAEEARQPVFLLGTAFAFVHLFDHCAANNLRFKMTDGSRAMETGGFKGRSREVTKNELYGMFEKFLGIPPARIVNEYGMTELSTQFYDQTLREGRQTNRKVVPPWARVVIIDPNTGKEASEGERGLIRICDLANLWSAMCIQTEDLGVAERRRLRNSRTGSRRGSAWVFAECGKSFAKMNTSQIDEAVRRTRQARERVQHRSTDAIVHALAHTARNWLNPDSPWRKRAIEQAPSVTGFSSAMVNEAVDLTFGAITEEALRELLLAGPTPNPSQEGNGGSGLPSSGGGWISDTTPNPDLSINTVATMPPNCSINKASHSQHCFVAQGSL